MSTSNSPKNKVIILNLDDGGEVRAQYNPKEISVDKSVPWSKHKDSKADQPNLEFSGADGRSMSFELMFDGYEEMKDVHATYVAALLKMAMVRNADGSEDEKRPPRVKITFGTLPAFEGVIESIGTKYTMFTEAGIPVRATCNVKFKEASRASFKKK